MLNLKKHCRENTDPYTIIENCRIDMARTYSIFYDKFVTPFISL